MKEKIKVNADERGFLIELFKAPGMGQVYYFTTKPGMTRGNHYHTRKKEYFCCLEGRAEICLRSKETGEKTKYEVSGEIPELIEIPVNHVHSVKNRGDSEMKIIAWISEVFNPEDPDTFYETV